MNEDEPTEEEMHAARLALQEIITCQVVLKELHQRDVLIREAVESHGPALIRSAAAFIHVHVADGVEPVDAENRFFYILTRVGDLCALLAHIGDVEVTTVVAELASQDFIYEDEAETQSSATDSAKAEEAMRAAQTCVIANHFVRRGGAPWGIQESLHLGDMAAVIEMLGHLFRIAITWFDEDHFADLVKALLADVEMILRAHAKANGLGVSEQVRLYFEHMMKRDLDL